MVRHIILSNQQFISLVERLGYLPLIHEEVQYRIGTDHVCEPFLTYTLEIKLPEKTRLPSLNKESFFLN